jgi:ankyrin repeat protein
MGLFWRSRAAKLLEAAAAGDVAAARAALDKGADVNRREDAVRARTQRPVRRFFTRSRTAPRLQAGKTPLSLAAERGHQALLLLLLSRDAEPGVVSTVRALTMQRHASPAVDIPHDRSLRRTAQRPRTGQHVARNRRACRRC